MKIALGHKNLSFTDWLAYTAKDKNPADKIAIYCLARMYCRHVVIYMLSFCWSTLLRHLSYNEQEIHKHCDIRLILLGKLKYAHVCPIHSSTSTIPKPFPTKVKKEDIKLSIKTENKTELPKCRCLWDSNIVSKMTCRGQKLANRSLNTNICSSNIFCDQSRAHNTRPTNNQTPKRASSKPLRESCQVINYAMLNDGLDPDRSPSPKRKHCQSV